MPEPALSGTLFHTHLKILRQIVGDRAFESAIAKLDADAQLAVGANAAIGWVPFSLVETVVSTIAETSGRGVEAVQREMVFASTREVLTGMWRMLAKALSPEFIMARMGMLWSRTYSIGKIHTESTTPNSATIRVSEFGAPSDYVLRGMSLTLEALLTELGRRAVRVKIDRTSDGATLAVHWRA